MQKFKAHKFKAWIFRKARLVRRLPGAHLVGILRRRLRRKPRFFQDHFKHVVRLAAREETKASVLPQFKISLVVPVFNTSRKHLDDLLRSIRAQRGQQIELILSDDGSTLAETCQWLATHKTAQGLVILRTSVNRGIAAATNAGIARASGDWLGLLDHDDALAPYAISRITRALANAPQCQFLYTDEVITDEKLVPVAYFLKPAFDPVLLSGMNYINHLSLYRRERLQSIGGLRDGFQGSQDHDLLLRYLKGLDASEVLHLPYPAYLWRRSEGSFSTRHMDTSIASARKALSEHYSTLDRNLTVTDAINKDLHRLRFDLAQTSWPKISVVLPSCNSFELISLVLSGLFEKTDYPDFEVIVIDNGTTDQNVLDLYEEYRQKYPYFQAHVLSEPFNFSRSVNRGIAIADGKVILLLNNDIEILDPSWLKEMVSCLEYEGTGIVGAKLLYPSRKIQHAGVIAGLAGLAGHWYINLEENFPGAMGRLWVRQSFSVVTGACLLLTRDCIRKVGLFDEDVFPVAYNDVDYCLRATALGIRVIWTPFACLIHHESASRGSDELDKNIERFERDKVNLRLRHRTDIYEDRAFNPWYSRSHSEPFPIKLKALPAAR